MTRLERKVRREFLLERDAHIVTLEPADERGPATLELRRKGTRKGYRVSLPSLFVILAQREADLARAARLSRRGNKAATRFGAAIVRR